MASSLRPPYHNDVSWISGVRAAAILVGIVAVLLGPLDAIGAETTRITAAEALERARAGGLTIVDIRRPDEWAETGLAENAERATIRSPRGNRGFLARIAEITGGDKSAPIGLICARGVRSHHAANLLRKRGFSNIYDINEGMLGNARGAGWLNNDLPITACSDC